MKIDFLIYGESGYIEQLNQSPVNDFVLGVRENKLAYPVVWSVKKQKFYILKKYRLRKTHLRDETYALEFEPNNLDSYLEFDINQGVEYFSVGKFLNQIKRNEI